MENIQKNEIGQCGPPINSATEDTYTNEAQHCCNECGIWYAG